MFIKRKKRFYILLIITILSMFTIFYISHMPYENQDIKPFLVTKLNNLDLTLPYFTFSYDGQQISTANQPALIEFLLRKIGHVVGYFFLAIFNFVTLNYTRISVKNRYVLTLLMAFTYAGLDKCHQTFVSGRTGHCKMLYSLMDLVSFLRFV